MGTHVAGVTGLGGGGGGFFLSGGGGIFLAGGGGGLLAGGERTSKPLAKSSPTVSAPSSGVCSAHSSR